ncbi:MAG: helix-turn-helix transcriptional regulator [Geminicoccaceae bacterium]|nr:helix-turn-helix transcriptional regulator [Geminicoccaceae bacterium]
MGDLIDARVRLFAIAAVIAGIALFLGLEMIEEPDAGPFELMIELIDILPTVLTSVGLVLLFRVTRRQHQDHVRLIRELERARSMGERWRNEARAYLDGLGVAIDRQFTVWGLTEAEREVALLLLKGLSHKEIATVRSTSERTVREQARSLYAKAGLGGRAALSAFFLEDLTAPIERVPLLEP